MCRSLGTARSLSLTVFTGDIILGHNQVRFLACLHVITTAVQTPDDVVFSSLLLLNYCMWQACEEFRLSLIGTRME